MLIFLRGNSKYVKIKVLIIIYFKMNYMKYLIIYLLSIILFSNTSFAVWDNEVEQWQSNASTILEYISGELLVNVIFAIFTIIVTFALSKFVWGRIMTYIEWLTEWEETNREEIAWVIERTVNITILAIGFSITLSILWVDMAIFLWGLWFWIWFTLKIFLSNFIAWIIMVTQWTYHNGDLIELEGKMWNIKRIHSLFTAVEQFDGVIYYVPNVKFLEDTVSNYNTNSKRRVEVSVWVDYKTDIIKVKKVLMQVIEQFPHVLRAPEPQVLVDKFDTSSINLQLRFWIDSKTGEYFITRSNVTETINLAFKQAGITIPFPQVTISNRENQVK